MSFALSIAATLVTVKSLLSYRSWTDATLNKASKIINGVAEKFSDARKWVKDRDDSPLSIEIDGSAEAVGVDTAARAKLAAEVTDYDQVSIGIGFAKFSAAAEGGPEAVITEAYSEIGGADWIFTLDQTRTGANWETSEHRFLAVDFAGVEFRRPLKIDVDRDLFSRRSVDVGEGNVATAQFDADVSGADTYLEVIAEAVAVEDRYSGSAISADLAIG